MKSVTNLIKDLTGESYSDFNYGSLGKRFAKDICSQDRKDANSENERYNPPVDTNHIDRVKQAVGKMIAKEKTAVDASLPVAPIFDAYQVAKSASTKNSRDLGLTNLATLLEKQWKKDRQASLTYQDFSNLKDHYKKNFPKSAALEVINSMVKNGYADLPMAELMEIASAITCQGDFEHQIVAHGLASNSPRNKKARQFILAAVNGNKSAGKKSQRYDDDDYDDSNFSESDPEYLADAWINGNRKHVLEIIGDDLPLFTQVRDMITEYDPEQRGVFDRVYQQMKGASKEDGVGKKSRKAQTKEMFDDPDFQKGEDQEVLENRRMNNPEWEDNKPKVEKVEKYVMGSSSGLSMDYEDMMNGVDLGDSMGQALTSAAQVFQALMETDSSDSVLEAVREAYNNATDEPDYDSGENYDDDAYMEAEDQQFEEWLTTIATLDDIWEALKENDIGIRGSTYNSWNWWGPTMDYTIVGEAEHDPYGSGVLFISQHLGGDVRGNYATNQVFKVDSYAEEAPWYDWRMYVRIYTDQGEISIDVEDTEAYYFIVNEDETGTWQNSDDIKYDDIISKLDWEDSINEIW